MSKIFISYNRQSEPIVRSLANDIESLGHTAWFDHELSGGQAWWEQILATVRDCSIFVFVLSPEGLNSTACKREYAYAAELGKPVLPVLVSDGVSINLLPPVLSKIEFVDYRKQDRDAAFRLARALSSVPPPGPLPDPLPEPPDAPVSYLGGLTEQVDSNSTLGYQEQTALLTDLKRSLRDPEDTEDARTLLRKLRKRRDLLATVADDIDELLRSVEKPIVRSADADSRPAYSDSRNVDEPKPPHATESKSAGTPSIQDDKRQPEDAGPTPQASGPTKKGMISGAGIGASAGFLLWLVAEAVLRVGLPSIGIIVLPLIGAVVGVVIARRPPYILG
jgi:TIR domain-containing protein